MKPLALLCCTSVLWAAKDKIQLTVVAVTHDSQIVERTSTYTTPGTNNTNCSGSATTVGNTTSGTANCQTTSNPPQTRQITARAMFVTDVVEANDMRYTITCRAGWVGSHCAPLIDGDSFPAEIDGNTMWLSARVGGNQGKQVRVKYKILDIRPVPQQ